MNDSQSSDLLVVSSKSLPDSLVRAARVGHLGIVNILLARGVDPDALDNDGRTALGEATFNGHTDIVKALLVSGAEPEKTPVALLEAASRGYLAIVKELLAYGADPNKPDRKGYTALYTAARRGRTDVVNALLANGAKPGKSPDVLVEAASRGHLAIVEALMAHGADPNTPDRTDRLALMLAVVHGRTEIVNALLVNGARPDKSPDALVEAAGRGHQVMVQKLLDHGADPDAPVYMGFTALFRAAAYNRIEVVKDLVTNGASPAKSPCALVVAARCGHLRIVQILLANGARPDTPGCNNLTALEHARLRGQEDIVNVLENHIPQLNPNSLLSIARTCIRTRLIERQADGVQLLSSSVAQLPLPELAKKYVHDHLTLEAGPPGELLWQ